MTFRDHHDNFQPQEHGADHLTNWAHQASNDATDFYRGQSRGQHNVPDMVAQTIDTLEFTPLFGNSHAHNRGQDRYMDNLRRVDPDLVDLVTPCPPGFNQKLWYGGHQSPEYTIARGVAASMSELSSIPDAAGRKQFIEQVLEDQVPALEKMGARVDDIQGDRMKIDFGHGRGAQWIDTVRDINGRPEVQLLNVTKLMNSVDNFGPHETLRVPPLNDGSYRQAPASAPEAENFAPCPPGYDSVKWNNGHDTPKYFVGHLMANFLQEDLKNPDRAGQEKRVEQFLKDHVGLLAAKGLTVQEVRNEKMLIDIHDGTGAHWVDTVVDVGGNNPYSSWQVGA